MKESVPQITFYVNEPKKEVTCVHKREDRKHQAKVRAMEGDDFNIFEGIAKSLMRVAFDEYCYKVLAKQAKVTVNYINDFSDEQEKTKPTAPIDGTGFTVNGFHFNPVGVDGIYVLDHVAFKDKFDEDGINNWEKSSGKKKLQEWAEKNMLKEILEQFDVDIPAIEEVFSQKMLNLFESTKNLKSCQFPIFQNSDNRMMEFDGRSICWWTRSAYPNDVSNRMQLVYTDGSTCNTYADYRNGFVPVLRRKAHK